MKNYIPLDVGIWSSKKFKALPNSDCRVIYFYLIANPAMTLSGIYHLDLDDCKLKTRIDSSFETNFNEVTCGKYNIEYDPNEEMIWVTTRFKRIPTKSAKVIVGAIDELQDIRHPFKEKFISKYRDIVSPFLHRLPEHKISKEEYMQEEQIIHLSKIYNSKASIKNFLLNRGIGEQKIDSILQQILPNLK